MIQHLECDRIILSGGVAQLGERLVRNQEVVSSILILSTKYPFKQSKEVLKARLSAGFLLGFRLFRGNIVQLHPCFDWGNS